MQGMVCVLLTSVLGDTSPVGWRRPSRREVRSEEAVGRILCPRRAAFIHLGRASPSGSSGLPGGGSRYLGKRGRTTLHPSTWPCSTWGLPCPARHRPGGALLPHPFTLTPGRPGSGLLSAALSLALPRPGVTRHVVRRESGPSSASRGERPPPPTARQIYVVTSRVSRLAAIAVDLETGAGTPHQSCCGALFFARMRRRASFSTDVAVQLVSSD